MHLLVHYLDIIRHFLAFAEQPFNWITNVTASVVIFAIISLFWPRARRAYKGWFEGHLKTLHKKLDEQHEGRLRHSESLNFLSRDLAKKHHAELLDHITKATAPVKKPVAKKVVAKTAPAKPTPRRTK